MITPDHPIVSFVEDRSKGEIDEIELVSGTRWVGKNRIPQRLIGYLDKWTLVPITQACYNRDFEWITPEKMKEILRTDFPISFDKPLDPKPFTFWNHPKHGICMLCQTIRHNDWKLISVRSGTEVDTLINGHDPQCERLIMNAKRIPGTLTIKDQTSENNTSVGPIKTSQISFSPQTINPEDDNLVFPKEEYTYNTGDERTISDARVIIERIIKEILADKELDTERLIGLIGEEQKYSGSVNCSDEIKSWKIEVETYPYDVRYAQIDISVLNANRKHLLTRRIYRKTKPDKTSPDQIDLINGSRWRGAVGDNILIGHGDLWTIVPYKSTYQPKFQWITAEKMKMILSESLSMYTQTPKPMSIWMHKTYGLCILCKPIKQTSDITIKHKSFDLLISTPATPIIPWYESFTFIQASSGREIDMVSNPYSVAQPAPGTLTITDHGLSFYAT